MSNLLGFSVDPQTFLLCVFIVIVVRVLVHTYIRVNDIMIKILSSVVLLPVLAMLVYNLIWSV